MTTPDDTVTVTELADWLAPPSRPCTTLRRGLVVRGGEGAAERARLAAAQAVLAE